MPRCLVFDLDGTLVDSVPDLAACLNRVLGARGLVPLTVTEVTAMVGDGVHILLQRGFAARNAAPDETAVAEFTADYEAHVADATRPFPGVTDALRRASDRGWRRCDRGSFRWRCCAGSAD